MQLSPMRRRTNITFSLFPRWWNSRCAWLANNDPAAVEALFAGFPVRPLPVRPETGVGVIFDDRGHRMSPTYTVRRRNRYRYYISQAQCVVVNRVRDPASAPMRSSNWWCRRSAVNGAAMIKWRTGRAERGAQISANWSEPQLIGSSSGTHGGTGAPAQSCAQ